jgi:hypothetical protein
MQLPNQSVSVIQKFIGEIAHTRRQGLLPQQLLARRASSPQFRREFTATAAAHSVFCNACKIQGCDCKYPNCVNCGFKALPPTTATDQGGAGDFFLALFGCYACGSNPDGTYIICCND